MLYQTWITTCRKSFRRFLNLLQEFLWPLITLDLFFSFSTFCFPSKFHHKPNWNHDCTALSSHLPSFLQTFIIQIRYPSFIYPCFFFLHALTLFSHTHMCKVSQTYTNSAFFFFDCFIVRFRTRIFGFWCRFNIDLDICECLKN